MATKVKCQYCGKWVVRDDSVANEAGHLCYELRERGLNTSALKVEHDKRIGTEFAGMAKTAQLHKVCAALNISIAKMVKAWGGDRMLSEPTDPKFRVVYGAKNARYISLFAFSADGLSKISGTKVDPKSARSAVAKVLGAQLAQDLYGK
jgi:hypothetical protein